MKQARDEVSTGRDCMQVISGMASRFINEREENSLEASSVWPLDTLMAENPRKTATGARVIVAYAVDSQLSNELCKEPFLCSHSPMV